jgi:hypothetical protein
MAWCLITYNIYTANKRLIERGSVISIPGLYLVDFGFQHQPRDQINLSGDFLHLLWPSRQMLRHCSKSDTTTYIASFRIHYTRNHTTAEHFVTCVVNAITARKKTTNLILHAVGHLIWNTHKARMYTCVYTYTTRESNKEKWVVMA